jgi:hypothetical protein
LSASQSYTLTAYGVSVDPNDLGNVHSTPTKKEEQKGQGVGEDVVMMRCDEVHDTNYATEE